MEQTKERELAWLRTIAGELATTTITRLEDTLAWYSEMPPGRRSAIASSVVKRAPCHAFANPGMAVVGLGTLLTAGLTLGGKTGTGDNRIESVGAGGRVISSRAMNRTATFVLSFCVGAMCRHGGIAGVGGVQNNFTIAQLGQICHFGQVCIQHARAIV